MTITYRPLQSLQSALAAVGDSPLDAGMVEMLVVRTGDGVRETPEVLELTPSTGVGGDHWSRGRYSSRPEMQVSLINSRVLDLIAGGDRSRWALAGDNLIVDLDIGIDNLPAGTRIQVGDATLEISEKAHRGCAKFEARYGSDARTFVNLDDGPRRRLRGLYASVVSPGTVSLHSPITKLRT